MLSVGHLSCLQMLGYAINLQFHNIPCKQYYAVS